MIYLDIKSSSDSMDAMVRNIDEAAYRELKARAALEGKTIGEILTRAIWAYVGGPAAVRKTGSIVDFKPERFPKGNERLSEEIDSIVYGV